MGGGTPERLTPEPDGAGPLMAAPVLLPGGRAVLFGSIDGETERVTVLDLATGEQRILLEGGQNPAYVATGHVVFARGTTLMAVPFDAAALAVTGEPVAVVPGVRHPNTQSATDYALSSTGTLVYVPGSEEHAPSATVVWVDRDGRAVERALSELDRIPAIRVCRPTASGSC